jgi:hypothetical protein
MKVGLCKKCGHQQAVGERVMGKLGMAAALALVGGNATRNPFAALLGACVGAAVGHALDEHLLPTCPGCKVALQLVNTAL